MKWPRKARITLIKASKGKIKGKGEIHGWDGNKINGHDSFVAFVWLLLRNNNHYPFSKYSYHASEALKNKSYKFHNIL